MAHWRNKDFVMTTTTTSTKTSYLSKGLITPSSYSIRKLESVDKDQL